jgi:hypothetical protein
MDFNLVSNQGISRPAKSGNTMEKTVGKENLLGLFMIFCMVITHGRYDSGAIRTNWAKCVELKFLNYPQAR